MQAWEGSRLHIPRMSPLSHKMPQASSNYTFEMNFLFMYFFSEAVVVVIIVSNNCRIPFERRILHLFNL